MGEQRRNAFQKPCGTKGRGSVEGAAPVRGGKLALEEWNEGEVDAGGDCHGERDAV